MTDARIRSFIAVDLAEPARRAAAELARTLRVAPGGDGVRWVRPETLHVTLRFLGQIEVSRVAGLARDVAEAIAAVPPLHLELGGVQVFPASRPRVVALELAPEAPLTALAAAVERGVVAAGFEPETRRFRPHLTLGRVRGRAAPDVTAVDPPAPSPFEVREVVLFRSDLGPQGARYTPLERMSLGGSIHPDGTQSKER